VKRHAAGTASVVLEGSEGTEVDTLAAACGAWVGWACLDLVVDLSDRPAAAVADVDLVFGQWAAA